MGTSSPGTKLSSCIQLYTVKRIRWILYHQLDCNHMVLLGYVWHGQVWAISHIYIFQQSQTSLALCHSYPHLFWTTDTANVCSFVLSTDRNTHFWFSFWHVWSQIKSRQIPLIKWESEVKKNSPFCRKNNRWGWGGGFPLNCCSVVAVKSLELYHLVCAGWFTCMPLTNITNTIVVWVCVSAFLCSPTRMQREMFSPFTPSP